MKNWTRRHTLIVGLALILLTNAVALLGVYWNRSGEPESMLRLTERELVQPYGWGMTRENSGVSLRINWRVPSAEMSRDYPYSGDNPVWLDQAKIASLGFDVAQSNMQDNYRWSSRQLSKEVLLVLELDGPAYQKALQLVRQYVAEQDTKLAALPEDKAMQKNVNRAHEDATREEQDNSRLFAIDAGLNLPELRAKYPDRNRYAIVHAQVRPWSIGEQGKIAGHIDRISITEINVPHAYHAAFDTKIRLATGRTSARQAFEASVAFGQRLEPWLIGMSSGE